MKVEIWSDVVCPWCYVGKRQFEDALSRFPHADQVEVVWRSFELDPNSPAKVGVPMSEILQRKYGMSAAAAEAANRRMTDLAASLGLEYHLDDVQADDRQLHRGAPDRVEQLPARKAAGLRGARPGRRARVDHIDIDGQEDPLAAIGGGP